MASTIVSDVCSVCALGNTPAAEGEWHTVDASRSDTIPAERTSKSRCRTAATGQSRDSIRISAPSVERLAIAHAALERIKGG